MRVGDGARQLALWADLAHLPDTALLQEGYVARLTQDADRGALGQLFFESYPRDAVVDHAAADEELDLTFKGEYGQLDFSLSPVVMYDSSLVAAVLTVEEAPWPDTGALPFIIEVMVHPSHRRRGLAEFAVATAMRSLCSRGKEEVGLRVMSDNAPAMNLYRKLGFKKKTQS